MSDSQNGAPTKAISTEPLPSSHKIYIESQRRPDVRVALRAIHLSGENGHNANSHHGENQPPLTVYDTSGPYTDSNVKTEIRRGLQALRADWIRARGDVEELSAPSYQPPARSNGHRKTSSTERFPDESRRPILRAKPGCNVSQMHYARQGIITLEMEYIVLRENIGRQQAWENGQSRTHNGYSFGAAIPKFVTAEFIRDEEGSG